MLRIEHTGSGTGRFLIEDPEDGHYHRAFQAAKVPGFNFGYFVAWEGNDRRAIVPYFVMNFQRSYDASRRTAET